MNNGNAEMDELIRREVAKQVKALRDEDFGREIGFIREVLATGLKNGADRDFYRALSGNPRLFKMTVEYVLSELTHTAQRPRFHPAVNLNYNDYSVHNRDHSDAWRRLLDAVTGESRSLSKDARVGALTNTTLTHMTGVYAELFTFWKQEVKEQILAKLSILQYRPATLLEGLWVAQHCSKELFRELGTDSMAMPGNRLTSEWPTLAYRFPNPAPSYMNLRFHQSDMELGPTVRVLAVKLSGEEIVRMRSEQMRSSH